MALAFEAPLHASRIVGCNWANRNRHPFFQWKGVPSEMTLPDPETLAALTGLVGAFAGVIGALATLVWNLRRKP